MAARSARPKLLAIVGPTASGKSELAMRLAKKFNGEIIAADSWTVYRGFNIGTSKPSDVDRAKIPHHLLDVSTPEKGFNAKRFKQLADRAIGSIQERGKLPILTGGTGLYIDSVLYNFGFLPVGAKGERQYLTSLSIPQLISRAKKQKISLTGIDIRNKRRIIRAIESRGKIPAREGARGDTSIIGIHPPADILSENIQKRTTKMIKDGLEAEVRQLAQKYGWNNEPMKGIGYREWHNYFEGHQTLQQTEDKINSSTKKLVKRQQTWFKRNPNIVWFDDTDSAYEYAKQVLNK